MAIATNRFAQRSLTYNPVGVGESTPMTINPYTGKPDSLAQLQPTLAGITSTPLASEGSGWGSGIGSWLQDIGFLGSTENGVQKQGWGGLALGAAQGLGNAFMGMKQYGLAKDQLAQSKKQFEMNYASQKKLTNANLADRQAARVASNPNAYQSVGDYMNKNGI